MDSSTVQIEAMETAIDPPVPVRLDLLVRQIETLGWNGTAGSTKPAGFRADLPLHQPENFALTGHYCNVADSITNVA